MSKTTFPDIFGPSTVAANNGTPVTIRNKVLNVISPGVTAADNPSKRRTDLTLADPSWVVVSTSVGSSGEWLPGSSTFVGADVVRVSSSTTGTILTGISTGTDDPTHLVKFVANVGSNSLTIRPPVSPIAGKQYYAGNAYTLGVSHVVRMTWDSVTRVYRIIGTGAVNNHIIIDGARIVLDGNPILNPN